MKWNERTKKSAAYGLVGLFGIFTGTFLPPEIFSQLLGGVLMEGALVIDAINAGGNLGLLFMGLALIRTNGRVARLEIQYELRQEAKSDIH